MSMLKRFAPGAAVAVVAIAVTTASARAESSVVSSAGQQSVHATVLSKDGTPVTNLQASDFIVREDGIEREVLGASTASEPMRIAVLVDTSQWMEPYISDVRRALPGFFRELQGDSQIAVYEFGDRPTRLVDYTSDMSRLNAGIGRLFSRSHSGAYALDAITDVSREFRAREGARPVIVVITAQGPEFSQRYHETVIDDVKAANATLHSLVLTRRRVPILNDGIREREATLSDGATVTGGRRQDLLTSMALADRLRDLARELKTQYQVVYTRPDTLIPPKKIEVAVRQPSLMVRAPRVPPGFRAQP
jgi:VWFA-related protein